MAFYWIVNCFESSLVLQYANWMNEFLGITSSWKFWEWMALSLEGRAAAPKGCLLGHWWASFGSWWVIVRTAGQNGPEVPSSTALLMFLTFLPFTAESQQRTGTFSGLSRRPFLSWSYSIQLGENAGLSGPACARDCRSELCNQLYFPAYNSL